MRASGEKSNDRMVIASLTRRWQSLRPRAGKQSGSHPTAPCSALAVNALARQRQGRSRSTCCVVPGGHEDRLGILRPLSAATCGPGGCSKHPEGGGSPLGRATPKEWLGDWDGHSGGPRSLDTVWCLSPLVPSNAGQGQAESGGIVLTTVYWAPDPGWCHPTGRCSYLPSVICYRQSIKPPPPPIPLSPSAWTSPPS
jgi:hypothetical protein